MVKAANFRDALSWQTFAVVLISLLAPTVVVGQQQNNNPSQSTPSAQTGHSEVSPPPPQPTKPAPDAKPQDNKKDTKPEDEEESRLKITVIAAETGKPIGNASVYIRYPEGKTFLTHKDKEAEMNFKTNQDGSVKVPSVPRGKILIQIVAPGWHTYGKWYDIAKEEEEIEIKLDKPPRWY